MELTNHALFGRNRPIIEANRDLAPQAPAWADLQARFAAAHAARRELLRMAAAGPVRSGGFEHWIANAADASFTAVNPVGSADGKCPGDMIVSTDGEVHAGDRGKQ